MIIRPVKESDIKKLSTLAKLTYVTAFGHSFDKEDLEAHLEKDCSEKFFQDAIFKDTILIAEKDKNIIGYTKFGEFSLPVEQALETDKELHRIFINPDFQGKGIGSMLMDKALNHPILKNASNIYLDVWEHNKGAQKFYTRYGFKVVGKHRFKVESGKDTDFDLIMMKTN